MPYNWKAMVPIQSNRSSIYSQMWSWQFNNLLKILQLWLIVHEITIVCVFRVFALIRREIFLIWKIDAVKRVDKSWDWLLFLFDATCNLTWTLNSASKCAVNDKASAIFRFATKAEISNDSSFFWNETTIDKESYETIEAMLKHINYD